MLIAQKSKIYTLSLFAIALISFSCSKDKEEDKEEMCIDETKIDLEAPCYLIYAPVCGCNGNTYSNDCVATTNGVLRFEEGACEDN